VGFEEIERPGKERLGAIAPETLEGLIGVPKASGGKMLQVGIGEGRGGAIQGVEKKGGWGKVCSGIPK